MLMLTVALSLQQVAEEVARDIKLENDLGQLPGHHPLIKDGMSDEGLLHQLQGSRCKILALITVQLLNIMA